MIEFVVIGGLVFLAYLGQGDTSNPEIDGKRRKQRLCQSPYPQALVADFENLGNKLAPSKKYISEVYETADKIFNYLQCGGRDHNLNIVHAKIAGSIGKGTGISYAKNGRWVNPDLDLVLFLDEVEGPPFEKEFKIFEELLKDLDEISGIEVRKFSIGFKIWTPLQGDIKVDLLVANNYARPSYSLGEEDVGEVETIMAMDDLDVKQIEAINKIQSVDQVNNKLLSSAFAEKTVQVIRGIVDDTFVLNAVRFAKYWNSTVDLSKFGYVPARSCTIELIAIHAQQTTNPNLQTEGRERCPVSAFRRFLEAMSKFRSLDISLDKDNEDALKDMPKPKVRDPINKWDNLARGIPLEVIQVWEEQAKKTLSLLEELRNNPNSYTENAIDEIFSNRGES